MRHTQTGPHGLWEGQRRKVVALGFDHQPDHRAIVDVERALLDQVSVDHGVEPAVVHHVVHVAIDIVVGPAGGDGTQDAVGTARQGLGACDRR
ncbi:hypothetical protein D9M68_799010 [compost metagenome]